MKVKCIRTYSRYGVTKGKIYDANIIDYGYFWIKKNDDELGAVIPPALVEVIEEKIYKPEDGLIVG